MFWFRTGSTFTRRRLGQLPQELAGQLVGGGQSWSTTQALVALDTDITYSQCLGVSKDGTFRGLEGRRGCRDLNRLRSAIHLRPGAG